MNPFQKAVHWGPNIVRVFEPTIFKSSAESHNDGVYLQNSCIPDVKSPPKPRCSQCKKKPSFKKDRIQGTGKNSHWVRRSAPRKDTKKKINCCPRTVKTHCSNKKQMKMPKNSSHSVRKCKRCEVGRRGENGLVVGRKHHSSAAHGHGRTSKPHKCDKDHSKDRSAKDCKKQISEKPWKISQKRMSNSKILEKETSYGEVTQVVKITGGHRVLCASSNHGLKIQIWLKPSPCVHCERR